MALPSVLCAQDLAKFRTKLCERLLSAGHCHYGDRCQYSHDPAWPRRNPEKVRYMPKRCSDANCARGRWCAMAHTEEEVLYHPEVYKEKPCPGGECCLGFYCPLSHGEADRRPEAARDEPTIGPPPGLERSPATERSSEDAEPLPGLLDAAASPQERRRAPRHRAGRRHTRQKDYLHLASTPPTRFGLRPSDSPDSDGSEADAPHWDASDRLRVAAAVDESGPEPGLEAGARLLGGRLRPGWLRKGGWQEQSHYKCIVKLVPVNRDDRGAANTALGEVQRWAESDRRRARLFVVRKTKATICLALPSQPSTLDRSVAAMGGGLAQHLERNWRLSLLAAQWTRQLISEADRVHGLLGTGHLCIAPRTVLVTPEGRLLLGDFLGKARVLHRLDGGATAWAGMGSGPADTWWEMWYPAEVVSCRPGEDAGDVVDHLSVDAWQLGVAVFYLLSGEHLFGDCRNDPEGVCRNIAQGQPVNLALLQQLPVFQDLVLRLTAKEPKQRPLPAALLESHPAFWSFEDTASFSVLLPAYLVNAGRQFDDPWLPMLQAIVPHLPWAAALGGAEPPSLTPPPTVLRVAEVLAVAGAAGGSAWQKHEAELHWHFDRLHSLNEDLPQYYEEAAAWERWGRVETPPVAAVAAKVAEPALEMAAMEMAEVEDVAVAEDAGGFAAQLPMATAFAEGGWGPSPALCAAFAEAGFDTFPGMCDDYAGAGLAAHDGVCEVVTGAAAASAAAAAAAAAEAAAAEAAAFATAVLGQEGIAMAPLEGFEIAQDSAPFQSYLPAKNPELSPVHVQPLNMGRFKENITPNRVASSSLSSRRFGKGAAKLPSSISPAYILLHEEVQGKDFPDDFDFSQEGIEAQMDVKSLPSVAFYAILELRRRRLNSSLRGLTADLRRLADLAV